MDMTIKCTISVAQSFLYNSLEDGLSLSRTPIRKILLENSIFSLLISISKIFHHILDVTMINLYHRLMLWLLGFNDLNCVSVFQVI